MKWTMDLRLWSLGKYNENVSTSVLQFSNEVFRTCLEVLCGGEPTNCCGCFVRKITVQAIYTGVKHSFLRQIFNSKKKPKMSVFIRMPSTWPQIISKPLWPSPDGGKKIFFSVYQAHCTFLCSLLGLGRRVWLHKYVNKEIALLFLSCSDHLSSTQHTRLFFELVSSFIPRNSKGLEVLCCVQGVFSAFIFFGRVDLLNICLNIVYRTFVSCVDRLTNTGFFVQLAGPLLGFRGQDEAWQWSSCREWLSYWLNSWGNLFLRFSRLKFFWCTVYTLSTDLHQQHQMDKRSLSAQNLPNDARVLPVLSVIWERLPKTDVRIINTLTI